MSKVFDSAPSRDGVPTWFADLQASAWSEFDAMDDPSRKDENWRFGSLKRAALDQFLAAGADSARAEEIVENSKSRAIEGKDGVEPILAVFSNNGMLLAPEVPAALAEQGVIIAPITEAAEKHEDLFRRYFMAQPATLGSEKFALLHKAQSRSGLMVYVPAGVKLEQPVEVFHWADGEGATTFPHTLIVAGEDAEVTVLDHFRSAGDEAGFVAPVFDLYAGNRSKVEYVVSQNINEVSRSLQLGTTVVDEGAHVRSFVVNLGGGWARTEHLSRIDGSEGHSDMLSVTVASDEQEFDQRTFQHHAVPRTTSDLLFKNAMYGKSRAVFSGLIFVDEGAHQTDAYQTCRNLLMSDDVEVNAMPGLEINADQVKCSHGSTSSRIDESEIFYFRSRGIPARMARKLITLGFIRDVVERISDDRVVQSVAREIEIKFDRIA